MIHFTVAFAAGFQCQGDFHGVAHGEVHEPIYWVEHGIWFWRSVDGKSIEYLDGQKWRASQTLNSIEELERVPHMKRIGRPGFLTG